MKTLIELYDSKNTIDNILASYIFQPDQEKVMPDGMEESLRTSFPDAPSAGEIKWFYTEKIRENH